MPLITEANVGEYISLYYDESIYRSFDEFCRSISSGKTNKVASTFARLILDGPYSSMTLGWIEDPGGAWELTNSDFPDYAYGWMIDRNTEVAAIHKTLIHVDESPTVTERPCYQCANMNFVTDKSCWWCTSPNPAKPR